MQDQSLEKSSLFQLEDKTAGKVEHSRLTTSARASLHCTRAAGLCTTEMLQRQEATAMGYTAEAAGQPLYSSDTSVLWHPCVDEAPLNVLLALELNRKLKDAAFSTCVCSSPCSLVTTFRYGSVQGSIMVHGEYTNVCSMYNSHQLS